MPLGTKSLAFINHKPFHPGSMANMEKTWLAERQHTEEQKRQKELREKRVQEAKIEDLRRALRVSENASTTSRNLTLAAERMEWMYENPTTLIREKEQEEFRLGKKIEPKVSSEVQDLKNLEDLPGSVFLPSVSKQSEDTMRKIREDPLFQIRKAEIEHERSRQKNPLLKKKMEPAPKQRKRSLSRSRSPDPIKKQKPKRERLGSEERARLVEEMKEEGKRHQKIKEERIIRDTKRSELVEKVEKFQRNKKNGSVLFSKLNAQIASKIC
eukprot:GHVP01040679.1.p1 GENE.GHVP01040679.1~~GHVP01040679.1.p1  ORF type:complete len:277 (-),score=67.71 GHVP01040679.1:535-1341(-)